MKFRVLKGEWKKTRGVTVVAEDGENVSVCWRRKHTMYNDGT